MQALRFEQLAVVLEVAAPFSEFGLDRLDRPLGALAQMVPARISIQEEDGQLLVTRPTDRGPKPLSQVGTP